MFINCGVQWTSSEIIDIIHHDSTIINIWVFEGLRLDFRDFGRGDYVLASDTSDSVGKNKGNEGPLYL